VQKNLARFHFLIHKVFLSFFKVSVTDNSILVPNVSRNSMKNCNLFVNEISSIYIVDYLNLFS
jgi:hypothetical protein